MSWGWGLAMGIIAVPLLAIAALLYKVALALKRVDDRLGELDVHPEQAKLLEQQNYKLDGIASAIVQRPRVYVPPTVHFCDRCRKDFPESNRWWTVYQFGWSPLTLCAYPQQKERPEDKWLCGEDCIKAVVRAYMASVQRQWQENKQQKREYTEYNESGSSNTHPLNVSHCGHCECEKEYAESDFWWTVSAKGMEIEIREGFHHSDYRASDYYFCSRDCTLKAVEAFIASQGEDLGQVSSEGQGLWEHYCAVASRSNSQPWHAAQPSPSPQLVSPALAVHEIGGANEPAHVSIPKAIGRTFWRLWHRKGI
jgi:hypothetical protein